MAIVFCDDETLTVEVQGFHKLWAMKRRLEISLANVVGITHPPTAPMPRWNAMKLPGSHIPGVLTAGTFRSAGEWTFYDVRNTAKTVVIELRDHRYSRIIVEVADPDEAVTCIERALHGQRGWI